MNKTSPLLNQVYYGCWLLFAASITLSKFATTFFFLAIGISWLWSIFLRKGKTLFAFRSAVLWSALALFLIFVLGLWNTENFDYAWKDLNSKTPLFFLPLWAFTGPQLTLKKYKEILLFLILGGMCSALIGFVNFTFFNQEVILNFRKLSPFISHIRLSLVLCIAVAYLYQQLFLRKSNLRWLLLLPIFFILYFLNRLQSLTGFFVLLILALYTFVKQTSWKDQPWLRGLALGVFVMVALFFGIKIFRISQLVFQDEVLPEAPELYTVNNNPYVHARYDSTTENGHLVYWFICDQELEQEWPKRSKLSLDTLIKGFPLRSTLYRYMSSRGFRKDSLGLTKMRMEDILAVERGIPNWYYNEHGGMDARLYTTLWEINNLRRGSNPLHTSLSRRLFLWKIASSCIAENFWLGVGTGDVLEVMEKEHLKSPLAELHRVWRPHNQFLTLWLSGGFFALILFLILLGYYWKGIRSIDFMLAVGFMVMFFSLFWEDTLESQAGSSLFALLVLVPQLFRTSITSIGQDNEG